MHIADKAKELVTMAEKNGASQAEAYAIIAKTDSIYIDDNIPKIGDSKTEFGVGFRFIIGKKIGFTSSTLLSESTEDVVARGSSMANVVEDDPKFVSLPSPKKVTVSEDKFLDKETANVDAAHLSDKAMLLVDAARDKHVTVPNGVIRRSILEYHICNSLGIDIGSKSTVLFGYFTAKSENDGTVGEGVQRMWSRRIADLDFVATGKKLNSQAMAVLKAKPLKENMEDVTAILAPSEGSEMLGTLVASAASGQNVNLRRSPWTDRVGDKIAHENLRMFDNGVSEKGILSAAVDDEGLPMQTTPLIEEGVLKTYLYDSYNAYQHDLESTSNGIRRSAREAHGRFLLSPSCAPTTLEVTPGSKTLEGLIADVDKGVYIEHFAYPQVNTTSGSFSNEIRNGQLIENGEITGQIKYALLVGNLYEAIQREILLSNSPEVNSRWFMPAIGLTGVELVGQK